MKLCLRIREGIFLVSSATALDRMVGLPMLLAKQRS